MVNGISGKQHAAVTQLTRNAEAAGITHDQLQQLLRGVTFDTGLFGTVTPKTVQDAFAGAAVELSRKAEQAPTPDDIRNGIISSAKSAATMLPLFEKALEGKDVADLPAAAYAPYMSFHDIGMELLGRALAPQLTLADAKVVVMGIFDKLLAQAEKGALGSPRDMTAYTLAHAQKGLATRGFSPADATALAAKAKLVETAVMHPDLREGNGMIPLPRDSERGAWAMLANPQAWQA